MQVYFTMCMHLALPYIKAKFLESLYCAFILVHTDSIAAFILLMALYTWQNLQADTL